MEKKFPETAKVEIRKVYDDHSVVVATFPVRFVQTSNSNDSDYRTIGTPTMTFIPLGKQVKWYCDITKEPE